ncbi:MAG: serine/threonine protein kinase [Myxococcales bacterium FL481]|nr:MAG: serine/threonine protein kinase [Myxococcales bacterium FL481]
MEGVLFFLIVFSAITLWKHMGHRHRERMLELQRQRSATTTQAAALAAATEERLRHLESIVCNVDFELNSKLNRLASHQPPAALPAAARMATAGGEALPAAVPANALASGQRVGGRFVIGRTLGRPDSSVYLARDEVLGESVALRVIDGLTLASGEGVERLRADLLVTRSISHPNVVSVLDVGEAGGRLLVPMAFVAGKTLEQHVADHRPLPLAAARQLIDEVAAALAAAHAQQLVHGGLEPASVIVSQSGGRPCAVVVDLGLAFAPGRRGLIAAGGVRSSSAAYRAPECIDGAEASGASDVYGLGAVAYYCLTGEPPFAGATPIAASLAATTGALRPPEELRAELSPHWSAWLTRALAKRPDDRFADLAEARGALPGPG